MTCSKTENASCTTDDSTVPAPDSAAPRLLAPPIRAARAAWQTGHHWHSGASLGGSSLVAVSHTSPLSRRSVPRVRFTWSATWLAMLRAPAFISQRWKSTTGSLARDWPRPPAGLPRLPDWPLPLGFGWLLVFGWPLLFGWPLACLGWPLLFLGWPASPG